MIRKILFTFLILSLSFFVKLESFAVSIPVENIFVDIDTDYKYYNELQTLYDKWMIFPDGDGKFAPYDLLNRDQFVGIASEVSCKRCIQPNTDVEFLNKYTTNPFFDISDGNKYFYCISDAKENNFVNGYDPSFTCDDGTFQSWEKPFCADNTIILEEALAVILRMSGILTNAEADAIRQEIADGNITADLADDVSPKNLDGSVYSFYPDFMRALEYELIDYDINGNQIVYHLIEKVDNKLRPKQSVTKEEFLRIAYVALKANSCIEREDNSLALKMNILDKVCTSTQENCSFSDIKDPNNIYDFTPETWGICEQGIREPDGYIWRFYNLDTGTEIKKYGEYIDNHEFLSDGKRKVFLRVIDNCGNTSEVHNTIVVWGSNLKVSLKANPIIGNGPLNVDFTGVASFGTTPYNYDWIFWDTNKWFGRLINNIYTGTWLYEVLLSVTDADWNTWDATALVKVLENQCGKDSDNDGINDCDDLCPVIEWVSENSGCPVLEVKCDNNDDCTTGYSCEKQSLWIWVCLPIAQEQGCIYGGGSVVFWNAIINSCPSNIFLDFKSSLRKCDKVFPAIVSPDSATIYSKWSIFEIK